MRLPTATCLVFSTIVIAGKDGSGVPSASSFPTDITSSQQPSHTTLQFIQTAPSRPSTQPQATLPATPEQQEELRRRQAAGQVNGDVADATVATQLSPTTTYSAYGPQGTLIPVTFTQLFSAVPDPWSGPTVGTIGLGTITGQIGIVKTNVKRDYAAEATAAVKKLVEKRAETNGAGEISISCWGTILAIGTGLLHFAI